MKCTTRVLGMTWNHHAWRRRVTSTETIPAIVTDMWGRDIAVEHVSCRTEEVCVSCGATRDTGYCFCDPARGGACPVRLRHLGMVRSS